MEMFLPTYSCNCISQNIKIVLPNSSKSTCICFTCFVLCLLLLVFFFFPLKFFILQTVLFNGIVRLWSANEGPTYTLHPDCRSFFYIFYYKIRHYTICNFYSNFIEKSAALPTIFLIVNIDKYYLELYTEKYVSKYCGIHYLIVFELLRWLQAFLPDQVYSAVQILRSLYEIAR